MGKQQQNYYDRDALAAAYRADTGTHDHECVLCGAEVECSQDHTGPEGPTACLSCLDEAEGTRSR